MASQSALRARVATIRELLAPDTSRQPCVAVYINRKTEGLPLLLTAGDDPPTDAPPPTPTTKRRDGHVCGPRCMSVSINFNPPLSEGTRGDSAAPQLALPAPVDASAPPTVPTGQSDAQRAPAGVYGDGGAVGNAVPEVPAREAVVEVEGSAAPAVQHPIGTDAESRAVWEDLQLLKEWWLPATEAPLGLCALPYCGHPAQEHRGIQLRLPCRRCGFRAEQHDPDGIALEVPQYARKVSPCNNYEAIGVDAVDCDRCEHPDCRCRGWRRWVSRDPSDPHVAFADLWAARDRLIAETERELAELRARIASEQRQGVKPNDYGPSPRTCPVFVKGEGT